MSNKNQSVRIVAAVVDVRNLTLYKENGETIIIPQGDSRVRSILDQCIGPLKMQNWADVTIDAVIEKNSYVDFEDKGSGLVKFFRVAKKKLKELLGVNSEPVEPLAVGHVPGPATQHIQTAGIHDVSEMDEVEAAIEQQAQVAQTAQRADVQQANAVVDEILKHAVPASSEDFHEETVAAQAKIVDSDGKTSGRHIEVSDEDAPDTIIAVVDGKIIPGVEKIKSQFDRAAKLGSTKGVEAFLARLGTVIDKRSHAVEDLLKFM